MDFDASRSGFGDSVGAKVSWTIQSLFAMFGWVKGFLARFSFGFGIFGTHRVSGEYDEGIFRAVDCLTEAVSTGAKTSKLRDPPRIPCSRSVRLRFFDSRAPIF